MPFPQLSKLSFDQSECGKNQTLIKQRFCAKFTAFIYSGGNSLVDTIGGECLVDP